MEGLYGASEESEMSLKPDLGQKSFFDTQTLCAELLPKENFYRVFSEQLFEILKDEDYQEMDSRLGRVALSPRRLSYVMLFQYLEKLSDRDAAEAVRIRLDWKLALHLAVDDPGFDSSTLTHFRDRLRGARRSSCCSTGWWRSCGSGGTCRRERRSEWTAWRS